LLVSSARSSVTTSSATARSVTRSPGIRAPAASDETGVGHELALLQQVITCAMLNQLRGSLRGCAGYGTRQLDTPPAAISSQPALTVNYAGLDRVTADRAGYSVLVHDG